MFNFFDFSNFVYIVIQSKRNMAHLALVEIDSDFCVACCQVKLLLSSFNIHMEERNSTATQFEQVLSKLDLLEKDVESNQSDLIRKYIVRMQALIAPMIGFIHGLGGYVEESVKKKNKDIFDIQCDEFTHILNNAKQACKIFDSRNTDKWTSLLERIVAVLDRGKPL